MNKNYFALIFLICIFVKHTYSSPLSFLQPKYDLDADDKKCRICMTVAHELEKILAEPQSVECVAAVTTDLCNKLDRFTPDVCTGVGIEYAPSLYYSLQNKVFNPDYLCGTLVGDSCSNNTLFGSWSVTFPNTTKPPIATPSPPNSKTYRVVHLSDIHYDRYYAPGSEADCDEPLCCRTQFGPGKNIMAGFWGTQAKCDMPIWTLENLFKHLKDNEKFDWMLWTGDMPPHDIWNQTRDNQLYVLNTVYGMLYDYLSDRQIYLAVGNHESAPCNSFPPHHSNVPPEYDISWLYNTLASNWSNWVSFVGDTQEDIKQIASYVTHIMPGLRLVSLNTQYCVEGNFWLYANQTDPDGSLAWLIEQLQAAETDGEKVHIIGHVPSGDHTCLRYWSANYYDIINRYENTVVGQFFGHTHSDQFSVFYENADTTARATNIMYVAPSVTTFSWRMPTYRVYTVDAFSFEVLDTETYMLNLTEANLTNKTEWKLEYKASEAYGMSSLLPEDWNNLINVFIKNETMLDKYYSYYDRNSNACDDSCQFNLLCEMRSGRSHDKETLCSDLPNYENRSLSTKIEESSIFVTIPPICLPPATTTATTPMTTGANALHTNLSYQLINLIMLFFMAFVLIA